MNALGAKMDCIAPASFTHPRTRHGEPPPCAKPGHWRAAKRARMASVFPSDDPIAPNKRIGKEWLNPPEKPRTFRFRPPFGALCLASVFKSCNDFRVCINMKAPMPPLSDANDIRIKAFSRYPLERSVIQIRL